MLLLMYLSNRFSVHVYAIYERKFSRSIVIEENNIQTRNDRMTGLILLNFQQ